MKILKIIQNLYRKLTKQNKDTCSTCIWWASEEENNMPMLTNGKRYCDVKKKYTSPNHACECYSKELFEATENSTQTPELEIDLNQEMELEK